MNKEVTKPLPLSMLHTLRVDSNIRYLNLDLVWCLLTIIGTALASFGLDSGLFGGTSTLGSVWAGALSALVHMQFVTVVVYAMSYCNVNIRAYRSTIIAVSVIGMYLVTKVLAIPEPTASLYAYSASITAGIVIVVKLKSLLYLSLDNLEALRLDNERA